MARIAGSSPWRRVAGLGWLLFWSVLLFAVAATWGDPGRVVDERLRWLQWFVLVSGLCVGFLVGRFGRERAEDEGRAVIELLRQLLYPAAILAALGLIGLRALGGGEPIGVVVTAFLAYWAGLDLALGAVPLMEGKPFRLTRPLPDDHSTESSESDRPPPW